MVRTARSILPMSQWHALGNVPPSALLESRETLHHAAQLLALAGASYLEAQPDDSHTSMTWLESTRALATHPIPADTEIRFELRVYDLTLLVVDAASAARRAEFPLDGKTRADALDWMRAQAAEAGLDGGRLRSRLHFAIAAHPTDNGAPFEQAADGTLEELTRWYADANLVLEERRRATPGAGPVRCWPHHFDIATLVRLPQPSSLETIGIGLSPGDDSYAEPYYYLGPYPTPSTTPRPLSVGKWNTTSWWGAALPGSEIVEHADAAEQAALVDRFIDEAMERLEGR